ncbi:MAG: hypothetical protein CME63_16225 [Halobacteriovoraceae bacterium]|nr:hypothetical protein [Halobacteriovoraceae bacterium]MBC99291.1 hypothetical protein [Halobacteriovoraceae bacterium]|tara:strand:+ start:63551 stop:63964 length:414 start_codon:yes stop_codon:yes gene_type:complete
MKIFSLFLIAFMSLSTFAEKSPFTYIEFGQFPGRGDFIQAENPDYLDENYTNLVIAINGVETQKIIDDTKKLYGSDYKCRLAEHFTETLEDIGMNIGDAVHLTVYLLDGGHQVIQVPNVELTEDNLLSVQFETNFCQ